jgi:hypothetical protein
MCYACRIRHNPASAAGCCRRSDPALGRPGACFSILSANRQRAQPGSCCPGPWRAGFRLRGCLP